MPSSDRGKLTNTGQTDTQPAKTLAVVVCQHLDWIWRGDLAIPLGQF